MKPSEWCKKKQEEATCPQAQYDYFVMYEMWLGRGL